jgi:hypothetical protein
MSLIVIPGGKRTRQPAGGARLRPIPSLASVVLPSVGAINLVTGASVTKGESIVIASSVQGLTYNSPASSGTDYLGSGVVSTGDSTLLVIASRDEVTPVAGISTVEQLAHTRRNADSGNYFSWDLGNGFGPAGDKLKPRASKVGVGPTPNAMWVNGKKFTSLDPISDDVATGQFYALALRLIGSTESDEILWMGCGNDAFSMKGRLAVGVVVKRAMSDAEISAATNSPQDLYGYLFAPSHRVVVYGAAAGGPTTWNDSVAETASAADTPTAISTRAAATAETTSAADTPSSVKTTAATAAETTSAADTPSSVKTTAATTAETSSSADTPAAVSTRLAAVAETGSAADAPDATATSASTGAGVEAASATDTPTAVSTRLAGVTETGSAADTPASVKTTAATATESSSSSESADGTVVPAGANVCAETASASDTVTCVIVTSGSIAEGTASAVDVGAAGGIWSDFVAETAAAVATQYVVEPISAIAPDVSKWIDNQTARIGSSAIDGDSGRIGSSRLSPSKPRL